MRIAVFGVGGVGGYFGGRLIEAGHDVALIARGENLAHLQEHGLEIRSPLGDAILPDVRAADDPAAVGPVDAVILGVKAWQVPAAAEAILPLIGPNTAVLPLQNGVEAVDQLCKTIKREHILGGVCRILVYRSGPGCFVHAGFRPSVTLGELHNETTQRLQDLAAALEQTLSAVEIPQDIESAIWQKFIFISAISGVGAATRVPFGVLRAIPESRRLYAEAVAEIAALATARSVAVPEGIVAAMLNTLDGLPPEGTASMQRDILEGRPSELEAQNGAVVRLAAESGVPVPVNRFLYHALLPQEMRARGKT